MIMRVDFSLDQLTVFVAVVEAGSFSGAGRRLGRVQSAVSYAIRQLEAAVGQPLFDRAGRTPSLTAAGQRMLGEARLVLAQAHAFSECAALLHDDTEPALRVAVDALYPTSALAAACAAFRGAFPATLLRIDVGLLGEVVEAVRDGRAELGCCNLAGQSPPELVTDFLGEVSLLPVCAPGHPLAAEPPPHPEPLLRQHLQIVHSERRDSSTRDQGVLASRTWRVTELALKISLIREGVGWGSLPAPAAAPLIAQGALVRLRPVPWPPHGHRLPLHAVTRQEQPLGRAGQWLRQRLRLT